MGWFSKFPWSKQYDEMDCGPTCLQIVARYYKKEYTQEYMRQLCNTSRAGSTIASLQEAAEQIGFDAEPIQIAFEELDEELFPCIAYWQQRHFTVVYKRRGDKVYVSDPAHGLITYSNEEFLSNWSKDGVNGILLAMAPGDDFYKPDASDPASQKTYGLSRILTYLKAYRSTLTLLALLLVITGVLQLAFPIITQRLVDKGINGRNLPYIYILLAAQFAFFLGRTLAEIYNSYALLKLGARLNIRLVADFFEKLFRLPLGFFDVKMSGDILQRIQDHSRIEYFLTHGALNIFIAVLNLFIFGGLLLWYNPLLFLIFAIGSLLYIAWFRYFMKQKAALDYKNFSKLVERQDKNLEMIYGMAEIKLNNAAALKKQQWERLQEEVFQNNYKTLRVTQWQQNGARIINELKNIALTFVSALLVVKGRISFGEMMAISYISGQLNMPITSIIDFMQQLQDAQLSARRINEIHSRTDESDDVQAPEQATPATGDLVLSGVSFKYDKTQAAPLVLNNIEMTIARNKITAIVGQSGCGKTTLLKLLLKFYEPGQGGIFVGDTPLAAIPHAEWRRHCGTVLQDAYLFSDTIAANICLDEAQPNPEKLQRALQIACLTDVLNSLPMGLATRIGPNGLQLSGGEKQRVLIARAVYHDPPFIFFDEATSALDAITENTIVTNLYHFFKNKTVVIVAHRLSTVQQAHQLVVMDKGMVVETGTHAALMQQNGWYRTLVGNQLPLDG
jgi:ATP-binding cassette, subfamily B, bacterial